jgi:hypothetical protein
MGLNEPPRILECPAHLVRERGQTVAVWIPAQSGLVIDEFLALLDSEPCIELEAVGFPANEGQIERDPTTRIWFVSFMTVVKDK